jgi:predicted MFS family arabinose efflux permease
LLSSVCQLGFETMSEPQAALPPAFQKLAISNLMAQSAEQLTLAAVPIVAVLMLEAGPGQIGVIAAVQSLPFLLLSIPLGLLADRMSRKKLMLLSEILRVVALMVLIAALLADQISVTLLAVVGFFAAVGTVGFSVSAPSLVPALVTRDNLAKANGRLELARSMAFAGGPALAGALIAWMGASTSFVLSLMLSLAAVGFLNQIQEPARAAVPARHPWLELKEGSYFVWNSNLLKPILFTSVAWNISWFVLQAIYVPYAIRTLGMDASAVGLTLACYGAGMILGSLMASKIVAQMRFGHAILLGPFFSVLAASVMALTLWWPSAKVAGISYFLFGFGPIIWTITSTTLRQSVTPNALMGRVTAINIVAGTGARPIGALLGGFVGEFGSDLVGLLVVVLGFTVQAIIISCSSVRHIQSAEQEAQKLNS